MVHVQRISTGNIRQGSFYTLGLSSTDRPLKDRWCQKEQNVKGCSEHALFGNNSEHEKRCVVERSCREQSQDESFKFEFGTRFNVEHSFIWDRISARRGCSTICPLKHSSGLPPTAYTKDAHACVLKKQSGATPSMYNSDFPHKTSPAHH